MMAQRLHDMSSVIEEVIRRELGTERVRRVLIQNELGSEDEPVFRVFVVCADEKSRPHTKDMLKTLRAVHGHLRSHDVAEQALISYVSSAEAEDLEARTH